MRVSIRRIGGFAGLSETIAELDTASLAPAAADELRRLVHETDFFHLAPVVPGDEIGADQFQLEITVRDADAQHTVTTGDSPGRANAALHRIVQACTRHA